MAAEFSAEEIMAVAEARLAQGMMPDDVGRIATDTRCNLQGSWYIALPGKKFDGHDFIGDAFCAGAIGCIVAERHGYSIASNSFPLLAVGDTVDALHRLARNWRRRLNPKLIAVTAGRGRCSFAAELCAKILRGQMSVCTDLDFASACAGTAIPALESLLSMPDETQCFVVTVAPDQPDETKALAEALLPTVVILTDDGFSHCRISHDAGQIVAAERSLVDKMDKVNGLCIVGSRSSELRAELKRDYGDRTLFYEEQNMQVEDDGARLSISLKDGHARLVIPRVDRFDAAEFWCALQCCARLGISQGAIADALEDLEESYEI